MWKNVKMLEEENKRLRTEREEWIQRALELSKLLHDERKERKAQDGINRVVNFE